MVRVRETAVAGTFYPANAVALSAQVQRFLDAAPTAVHQPKAIIAPHAGYVYSGAVAGSAYAPLRAMRGRVSRVLLLGPAHTMAVRGLAASSADAFCTPLGNVPVDRPAMQVLLALPQVQELDAAHAAEHGLEVQLPFLQMTLGSFQIAPLVVGSATAAQAAQALDAVWGGPETLIVVSSDLSHYHDYATAQRLDRATAAAIEALRPSLLTPQSACGYVPIRGLLAVAARRGLRAHTLDLRNSGDTAGARSRVVGYGAFAFTEA